MTSPHLFLSLPFPDNGALFTNADNKERARYEEAIRRYDGPLQIVLSDYAYACPKFSTGSATPGIGPLLSGDFSVHVLNYTYALEKELQRFSTLLRQIRQEHEKDPTP